MSLCPATPLSFSIYISNSTEIKLFIPFQNFSLTYFVIIFSGVELVFLYIIFNVSINFLIIKNFIYHLLSYYFYEIFAYEYMHLIIFLVHKLRGTYHDLTYSFSYWWTFKFFFRDFRKMLPRSFSYNSYAHV